MKKLALFASGNGTNVQQISEYFNGHNEIKVDCIVVNKKGIYVIERARNLGIDCFYFDRKDFYCTDKVLELMKERNIDYIILAGFLWLVPQNLLKFYDHRIINIHPALLPNYGGKGMYGCHVHNAVIEAKEKESGITIHYINEKYDSGDIIFQAKCNILPSDTPEDLAKSIHTLEKTFFPQIIEKVICKKIENNIVTQ
ncbi:MAG: phosphoribosylglycinamide formyltransferase [Bacteroidales bacterium]